MSNCYHPELKIAFVHVPKCAGTSVSRELLNHGFLNAEDNVWYNRSIDQFKNKINIDEYTIVATVRNPVNWMTSGYRYCNYWNLTFEQHLRFVLNPKKRPDPFYKDWYWHCAILPDSHFPNTTKVFKVEELDRLNEWFEKQLNTTINIPYVNTTEGETVVSNTELDLIKQFTKEYADRWKYDY